MYSACHSLPRAMQARAWTAWSHARPISCSAGGGETCGSSDAAPNSKRKLGARAPNSPAGANAITVEVVSLDLQLAKPLGGDLLVAGIAGTIEARAHNEPAAVGRVADEVDDRFVGPERPAAPVDRDEGEQSVPDLVPLARAGREVADVDREVEFVGDALTPGRGVAIGLPATLKP